MQKSSLTLLYFYLPFPFKDRKYVTGGGPIQNFTIPNITNADDDPIFSVSGDIALNWWHGDNGVRIALTGGYLSAQNYHDENTHGLGINLWLDKENRAEELNPDYKIEISNIQDCPQPYCPFSKRKVQGKSHGPFFNSGPVYGNYAVYVSNSKNNFPTDQNLGLVMKSKKPYLQFHTLYLTIFRKTSS